MNYVIKMLIVTAGFISVGAVLWTVLVQPRIDIIEMEHRQALVVAEESQRMYERARNQVDELRAELKHRQQVLDALETFKSALASNLRTTEARIQEAINSENSPELVACFDLPVDAFHRSVRNVPEAAPAAD